jgi:hypothetical protein
VRIGERSRLFLSVSLRPQLQKRAHQDRLLSAELNCWETLDSGSGLAGFSADCGSPSKARDNVGGSQAGFPGALARSRKASEACASEEQGESPPERRLRLTTFVDNKLLCWHPTDKTSKMELQQLPKNLPF